LLPRTFNHAGLGNMPCDSVARKSALIPMVSHALPPMQWASVAAKRLECGSLLPLCFYAQTTCLEPDRHSVQNNVSVPISASPLQTSATADWNNGQFAGRAAIRA